MTGFQCTNCHYESMTKTTFCPRCSKRDLVEMNVPTEGEVYSYTTIQVAPPEYAHLAPYQVALVQLTENLKVTAFLQDKVQIGDKVRLQEQTDHAFIFTVI